MYIFQTRRTHKTCTWESLIFSFFLFNQLFSVIKSIIFIITFIMVTLVIVSQQISSVCRWCCLFKGFIFVHDDLLGALFPCSCRVYLCWRITYWFSLEIDILQAIRSKRKDNSCLHAYWDSFILFTFVLLISWKDKLFLSQIHVMFLIGN